MCVLGMNFHEKIELQCLTADDDDQQRLNDCVQLKQAANKRWKYMGE